MGIDTRAAASGRFALCSLLGLLMLAGGAARAGAQPPPIDGVTGTMAVEGNVAQIDRAAGTVIVAGADGVRHLFHFTKALVVHGAKASNADAFAGVSEGSTVVIHYSKTGSDAVAHEVDRIADDGLKTAKATVVRVDRDRKEMTITREDGRREVLKLTDRAATLAARDADKATVSGSTVVVYYTDEDGGKVAHFFKRVS